MMIVFHIRIMTQRKNFIWGSNVLKTLPQSWVFLFNFLFLFPFLLTLISSMAPHCFMTGLFFNTCFCHSLSFIALCSPESDSSLFLPNPVPHCFHTSALTNSFPCLLCIFLPSWIKSQLSSRPRWSATSSLNPRQNMCRAMTLWTLSSRPSSTRSRRSASRQVISVPGLSLRRLWALSGCRLPSLNLYIFLQDSSL